MTPRKKYEERTVGMSSLDVEITDLLVQVAEDSVLDKALELAAEYNLPPQHIYALACNALLISMINGIASINDLNGQPDWDKNKFLRQAEKLMNEAFQEPQTITRDN
jgi:hypothetical protein